MAAYFIHWNQREDAKEGYMKSALGGRLRGQERARRGNLWEWRKSKMRDTHYFYISVCRIVNN